jgi:hypothetical protein
MPLPPPPKEQAAQQAPAAAKGEPFLWVDVEEWLAGSDPRDCVCAREEDRPSDDVVLTPLYTAPQTVERLTDEEVRELVGNYFAEDWAQKAARGLLHDFANAIAKKNGLTLKDTTK